MYIGYVNPKVTVNLLSWIYWYFDEPEAYKTCGFRFGFLGSPYRRVFLRLFGFEFEWNYRIY